MDSGEDERQRGEAEASGIDDDVGARLARLIHAGVIVVDPRQTWVGREVDLARVSARAVLHPGTRLLGARTFVGADAQIGTEGPATVRDAVLDRDASIASGTVSGAVLLRGASLGPNAHVREGTLLEEEASTAHAVGLKHTILMACATVGSLVNLCDCLLSGGTSREDHSEVGSGFIHFNFTPWGRRGDKATPSLFGDVEHGVFLRQARIFLGGAGGVVGPRRVGFGSVVGAGQVLRRDVDDDTLIVEPPRAVERSVERHRLDAVDTRVDANVEYIAQLEALRAWYAEVRLPRVTELAARLVVEAALDTLTLASHERRRRLFDYLVERGVRPAQEMLTPFALTGKDQVSAPTLPPCADGDHLAWVRALDDEHVLAARAWLGNVVARVGAAFVRANVRRTSA